MSVENLPFNLFTSNILSARYHLLIGSIADRAPRCVVADIVALPRSIPIPNLSAIASAVALVCLSVDVYVLLGGISPRSSL